MRRPWRIEPPLAQLSDDQLDEVGQALAEEQSGRQARREFLAELGKRRRRRWIRLVP